MAVANRNKAAELQPLSLKAGNGVVRLAVAEWASLLEPRGEVLSTLNESPGAQGAPQQVHARFTSLLWGFADDLWVRVACDDRGLARVEAQGQLRLGMGDLDVNLHRVERLWAHLEATFAVAESGGQQGSKEKRKDREEEEDLAAAAAARGFGMGGMVDASGAGSGGSGSAEGNGTRAATAGAKQPELTVAPGSWCLH